MHTIPYITFVATICISNHTHIHMNLAADLGLSTWSEAFGWPSVLATRHVDLHFKPLPHSMGIITSRNFQKCSLAIQLRVMTYI